METRRVLAFPSVGYKKLNVASRNFEIFFWPEIFFGKKEHNELPEGIFSNKTIQFLKLKPTL